jgi:RHS repeat-associated protein
MGWRLDVGSIERNTKDGFPLQYSTASPAVPQTAYDDGKGFLLNLFGKEIKLLPTATANEYRAEVDTAFLRCVLDTNNNRWQVYDKSGNVYSFGQTTNSRVANVKTSWSGYSGTFCWALDQIITASGDWTTVAYTNFTSPDTALPERTLYPFQITYNGHTNFNGYSASVGGPNTITFGTEIRPDRRFSYRWGFRTEQNRRLTNIVCQAGGQKVWRYALGYGTSPATKRSLLKTVTTYGSDDNTTLPVQTFNYQGNPNGVSFGSTLKWTNVNLTYPGQTSVYDPYLTGLAGNSTYVMNDLVDIDGDGLPDRIVYDFTNSYFVQKNLGMQINGNGLFGPRRAFGPVGSSASSVLSATNPVPGSDDTWGAINTLHARLRDINGDGLPDRVCDYWETYATNGTPYTNYDVMLNAGTGFVAMAAWPVSDGPAAAGTDLNLYQCVESGGVDVGFFDINGDGLPDRVMSMYYTEGAMTYYRVQFNTGTNFTPVRLFGPYHSLNWNNYPGGQTNNNKPYYWAGNETPDIHMIDINGDGLPDRVMWPMDPNNQGAESSIATTSTVTTNYCLEFNDGYTFEAVSTSTNVPGAFDVWPGVNSQSNTYSVNYTAMMNLPYVGMYDLNGDGLPDRVMLCTTNTGSWLVYLNNGRGFNATPIVVTNIDAQGQAYNQAWWAVHGSFVGNTYVTLMDINGDGLLDRVMNVYDSSLNDATTRSNYFYVQLNDGPFPDLLTTISNGIGGVINVAYKPSTVWDNRKYPTDTNSYSTLPFPKQTVTTIIEYDGINPPRTNSYSYAGGYYDGPRREFHGFAVVTNIDASLRTTITYFHQGGGRDYSALGEIADPGSFAKDGMAFRTEYYGTDGLLYKMVINQVDQTNIGTSTYLRYFPFVSQTFEYDYPGGGSPRTTGSKFVYSPTATDAKIFNLTRKVLWGEVTNVSFTSIAAPTDVVSADTTTNVITYATLSGNSYILDHPDTVDLVDSGNNVIQETKYAYDQTSGQITAKLTRIASGVYATNSLGNYNAYGLATLKTDPEGVQTSITAFDSTYTYPTTTTVGGSFITTASYDARSGLETGVTDPMNVTVTNFYDTFYRLTESDKIPAGGTSVWMKKVGYNLGVITNGNAVSYIAETNNDGVGGMESRTYVDGFGRPIQTCIQGEAGNYRVMSTAYDERGNAFLTTWPIFGNQSFNKPSGNLTATWVGFDAAGRPATNRPVTASFNATTGAFSSKNDNGGDAGTSPMGPMIMSYVNGTDPWWIVCTDEDSKVRRYGLNAFGRTNQIQEVDGSSIYTNLLKYDLAGNLTNIVNANTQSIYWAYNDAGGMVAFDDPHLGQWTYVRDYANRVRVQTDGRGNVVSNSYLNAGQQDPLGRLQTQTVYGTNYTNHLLVPAFTNVYVYDSNGGDSAYSVYPGLLYKVTDSEGWEKNGYDNRGRLIKTVRYLNINGQTYTNSYTYNDGDKVTTVTYPNGGPVITNAYFTGGTIQQVSRIGGSSYYTVSAANIDEFGHVTQFAYGNGLTTARSYYTASKRLSGITCGTVFSRAYQYSMGDDVTFINGTGVTNVTVGYDNLHRIKSFTGTSGLSGNYGYDSVGNMTTNIESGSAVAYNYANPRKQAVRTAFGYTNLYDLCGNMIVRHGGLTNPQAMTCDAENRLKIFSVAGKIVVEYGYGADDARLWKRVDQNTNPMQVWIGNTYEEKNDTNGNRKVLFHVYAGGQQVCTFETNSPLFGGSDSSKVGYYYHEDNLNSSSALSDSAHNQIEVNAYYPFGRVQTANPQASFKVSRQFTGQIKDDETGLYYFNARYYDPELGRFIQADDRIPDLSNPQSYNRYSYVMNNPLRYTDPSGHQTTPAEAEPEREFEGEITREIRESQNINSRGQRIVTTEQRVQESRELANSAAAMKMRGLDPNKTYIGGPATTKPMTEKELGDWVRDPQRSWNTAIGGRGPVLKGQEGVAKSQAAEKEKGGTILGGGITFELPSGGRTVADTVAQPAEGGLKIIESKNGPTARLSPRQKEAQQAVQNGQPLIPRGGNAEKAGLTPGEPVQINKYQEDRH